MSDFECVPRGTTEKVKAYEEALELWQNYIDCTALDASGQNMTEKDVYEKVQKVLEKYKEKVKL